MQADLFKLNYFAPGSLRMPDSPLVRKYLEMSNDVHMLEAITGEDATTRLARANALASAVSSGALGTVGEQLRQGAPPAERAAAAVAAVERDGASGTTSHIVAQAQASKEILLKQLIELSDQLAQVRPPFPARTVTAQSRPHPTWPATGPSKASSGVLLCRVCSHVRILTPQSSD